MKQYTEPMKEILHGLITGKYRIEKGNSYFLIVRNSDSELIAEYWPQNQYLSIL